MRCGRIVVFGGRVERKSGGEKDKDLCILSKLSRMESIQKLFRGEEYASPR